MTDVKRAPGHDYGYEAQQAAEDHLNLCEEWQQWEDGEEEGEAEPEKGNPAIGPYCGCTTCMIREILHVAWPIIDAGVRSGDFDEPGAEALPSPPWGPNCHSCDDYRVQMVPVGTSNYICPRCGATSGSCA